MRSDWFPVQGTSSHVESVVRNLIHMQTHVHVTCALIERFDSFACHVEVLTPQARFEIGFDSMTQEIHLGDLSDVIIQIKLMA